jgi:adenylate kinase family enzyme
MKIVIIGNSGSGKTWLAKRFGIILSAPVVHLDDLFWEPGGFDKKRNIDQIELLIQQHKNKAAWIAEGVFGELAEHYLEDAMFLVWLDIDWIICKKRLEERGSESKRHMGRQQSKEGLLRLLEWASNYYDRQDLRSYEGHKALFEKFSGKKAHLSSETAVNKFLSKAQPISGADGVNIGSRRSGSDHVKFLKFMDKLCI